MSERAERSESGPDANTETSAASETTPTYRTILDGLDFDPIWIESDQSLVFCLSMIFSENRYPLFGIMRWFSYARAYWLNHSRVRVHACWAVTLL